MEKLEPKAILAVTIDGPDCRRLSYHSHMANEFSLCLKGKGAHQTSMGESPFRKGELYFFPRGLAHCHGVVSKDCRLVSVRFRDEALLSESKIDEDARARLCYFRRRAYLGKHRVEMDPGTRKRIRELFMQAVEEERRKESGYENMLKGYALQALVILTRTKEAQSLINDRGGYYRLVDVLSMINDDPSRECGVDEAAAMAHLSRSHFHAKFKALTGTTLVGYVTRLRVGAACRYLSDTDAGVIDIGFEVGFNSVSRFYQAFSRITGMSPKAWRKSRPSRNGK